MSLKIVKGDLIKMAKAGKFDVITHGCNCFCVMGAGIAPLMAKEFGCDNFKMEGDVFKGKYEKLGNIDWLKVGHVFVVNSYTQFAPGQPGRYGIPLDYDALSLCLAKINETFKYHRVGLPFIGAGLAGGDPERIVKLMIGNLDNVDATLVIFEDHLFKLMKEKGYVS
jgi:O-acetyl-ADP-ribose deacetylase (regulator of RNase III)